MNCELKGRKQQQKCQNSTEKRWKFEVFNPSFSNIQSCQMFSTFMGNAPNPLKKSKIREQQMAQQSFH